MQFSHRLYYWLKPAVPWRARMTLRRIVAKRERIAHHNVWPIKKSAAIRPANWPGWPEGKRFAVVLTHDVESADGLAQVQKLAELEMAHGFRSSFNFIPDGPYNVRPELRDWLTNRGFEVGVHDLQHDGRLFQSPRSFAEKAVRINRHLRDWNAVGFRAGFMLRNLEWFHQLDIEYDASTFDTDPFELQSDGADTIYPHWIPRYADGGQGASTAGSRGYVELPYTLPQDSTLFLVLKEASSTIWLQKTDWIANNGGMVLVNVHPDYIDFTEGPGTSRRYPSSRYIDLLGHISNHYGGQYWSPLPKQLAAWFKESTSEQRTSPLSRRAATYIPHLRGKRAAVILYSEFPADPRPRRAAEAMIEAGMSVDVLCTAGLTNELESERHGLLSVKRLPIKRTRESKLGYLGKYARFTASAFWFLSRRALWRNYDIIHVHNMPDVLVFSTVFCKLFGSKVILDLHDPMPEVMMTIYGFDESRLAVRMLKRMERWSIALADTVITVNEACRRIFSARSCSAEKIHVVMNSPDETLFQPGAQDAEDEERFVVMYHGSIVERHGLDIAIGAFQQLLPSAPLAELRIYGNETPFLRKVMALVHANNLSGAVKYFGPKPLEEIVKAIRTCDVGIIPNRRSIFTELNTPTRIFEYLSQGKPVIAPRAAGILDYFGLNDLIFFELGDVSDLAEKLKEVHRQRGQMDSIVQRGQIIYQAHLWRNEKRRLMSAVAQTLGFATAIEDRCDPTREPESHTRVLAK